MQSPRNPSTSSNPEPPPATLPTYVYRVHREGAQTHYKFSTGFRSRNQTTILNQLGNLNSFALAHLLCQTNISSPLISVYDNQAHAETIARAYAEKYGEQTSVMTIRTDQFARGPVFRAADLLAGRDDQARGSWQEILHRGEYLVMYKIPAQALVTETFIAAEPQIKQNPAGVIGMGIAGRR